MLTVDPWYQECSTGYVSTYAGSTSCTGCEAGRFATDHTNLYGVVTKATNCSACPGGFYQSSDQFVFCVPCDGGTSSGMASSACTTCAAGTYAPTGSARCGGWAGYHFLSVQRCGRLYSK